MVLLVISELGFCAKLFVASVTSKVFQVSVFDVGLQASLVKVHLPADVAWSAQGSMGIFEVKPDINDIGPHLFTTNSA